MAITILSATIAGLAAFLIRGLVNALNRRRAARDLATGRNQQGGALVLVRSGTWRWVVWRVLGILFVVVGGFFTLVVAVAAGDTDGPGPTIAAVAILLAGVGGLLLSSALRGTRITAMPGYLLVRQGLRAERVVPLESIAAVGPLANPYGGLEAFGAEGDRLFWVDGLSTGYSELAAYLDERVVQPALRRGPVPGPDGRPVAP